MGMMQDMDTMERKESKARIMGEEKTECERTTRRRRQGNGEIESNNASNGDSEDSTENEDDEMDTAEHDEWADAALFL